MIGILASRPAAGQATAGASIIGQVTDATGAVLPGVTGTVTSPALQMPSVVIVTDQRVEYRLTPLPIGSYTVTYDLAADFAHRRVVRVQKGHACLAKGSSRDDWMLRFDGRDDDRGRRCLAVASVCRRQMPPSSRML